MSWIWLAILLFFLVFFGGIFFLVNYGIQIQKRALQTIYQEQYATRQEVNRLARALDALLTDREVSPPTGAANVKAQAALIPEGVDQLLLTGVKNRAQATQPAKPAAPASSLDLNM